MDVVVRNYILSDASARGQWLPRITNYIDFSRTNQLSATAISGLGEPKFNPDGSPYMGDWGRPQNDGPALRALTAIRFARELLSEGQWDYVQSKLYDGQFPTNSLIKADLEYVARHWSDLSFDLWEEVKGDHFYTRIVQAAALTQGAALARTLNDSGAGAFYDSQAEAVINSLASFWDPNLGMIRVTLNRVKGGEAKRGLDSAIILGVLHAGFKQGPFTVLDSRVMATALKLETGFAAIYSVNDPARFPNFGPAIGRYPEDIYSGTANLLQGNPWVLSTAALAQYYYELATMLNQVSQFPIDDTNAAFLAHLALNGINVQPGLAFAHGSAEMGQLVQALMARGDLFMERIRLHENVDGSLSEQIDRNSGYMSSARDLTWSYASFITAQWARQSF
jgi:glucoamylase